MPRKKKDGHYINYYIDRGVYERLQQFAESHGHTATYAVEYLLKLGLDESERREKNDLRNKQPMSP